MKKFTSLVLGVIMCVMMGGLVLVGCNKNYDDTIIGEIEQEQISMLVSATHDKIQIELNSNEEEVGNTNVKVIGMKAYQYFEADKLNGLSKEIVGQDLVGGVEIDTYSLGTTKSIEFDRFGEDGYDNLYNKYYVVYGERVLRGPVYATEIEDMITEAPSLDIKSKKGMFTENSYTTGLAYYNDLNCSYATLNFSINTYLYPNEIIEDGEIIELAPPTDSNAIAFVSNGKTYYFNKALVNAFDRLIRAYYNAGAHITMIITIKNTTNQEEVPQSLTYYPWSSQGTAIMAINTANELGFGYYIATMEFLASRYTQAGFPNGYIGNFVIGNEIDYAKDYNRISEEQASLDTYMEEYSRLLRLSNLAVKKYDNNITVCLPITQAWAEPGYTLSDNSVAAYAPLVMVEWLNAKTKMEGDYNWGLAPHCYTYGLFSPQVSLMDTLTNGGRKAGMTGKYLTSSKVTFSNLEILDKYLHSKKMTVNGALRPVYLTESGVNSYDFGNEKNAEEYQAASIAQAYYKISQLESIVAFSYYRLIDHPNEQPKFGLIYTDGQLKLAYEVYKYIDTQYSERVANKYISYVEYEDNDGVMHNKNDIKAYTDALDVFGTGYFEEFDWSLATTNDCEIVLEWEDKIDLGNIKFESKNFLYDGTEKSVEVVNVPEGVEVTYSEEPTQTEIGSKTILATFTKDGEVVGNREASITVSKLSTNKVVYEFGENIYVTTTREGETLAKDAWIGIYKKGAVPGEGEDVSTYYYYFNENDDNYIRTICLQDNKLNEVHGLLTGEYVIYYFVNGGYDYLYSIDIEIVSQVMLTDNVDLSDVKFVDTEVVFDGTSASLTISGTLPEGVSVEYENNTINELGSVQAIAIFKKDGIEIERRYAVLTAVLDRLLINGETTDNKTYYFYEGEEIIVTATASDSSPLSQWWVGVYAEGDKYTGTNVAFSLYWYYVKDANRPNGSEVSIKNLTFNDPDREYLKDLPAGKYIIALYNTSGYSLETEKTIVILPEKTA